MSQSSMPQQSSSQFSTPSQFSGTLYDIRWNEVCLPLILVRALRVSVLVRVLGLSLVGVLLTEWGWSWFDQIFESGAAHLTPLTDLLPYQTTSGLVERATDWTSWRDPLTCAWSWLSEPLVRSARLDSGWQQSMVLILSGIWAIVVWALLGGAISRIAALYLTRGETLGPLMALKEAFQKWPALIGATLIPLIGSALLALPMVLAGLMLRSDFMALVIGLCWIVVILWGFVLAVILIGLLIGWPLMWATLGVERTDAFDGVSRCYAYVYQRPMHLILYLALAIALGWLGQFGVTYFALSAASLGEWAVSWGAGRETLATLLAPVAMEASGVELDAADGVSGLVVSGAAGIRFWKATLRLGVASYSVAYLWSASVGIYLLLRRQIDATEMDEVVIDEGSEESLHGLPTLHADPSGVPSIDATGGA